MQEYLPSTPKQWVAMLGFLVCGLGGQYMLVPTKLDAQVTQLTSKIESAAMTTAENKNQIIQLGAKIDLNKAEREASITKLSDKIGELSEQQARLSQKIEDFIDFEKRHK